MSTDIKVITNEHLYEPCCTAMPDLWHAYCAMVGRPPDSAMHWLVIDVINAMQARGCPTCGSEGSASSFGEGSTSFVEVSSGDKGNVHDAG